MISLGDSSRFRAVRDGWQALVNEHGSYANIVSRGGPLANVRRWEEAVEKWKAYGTPWKVLGSGLALGPVGLATAIPAAMAANGVTERWELAAIDDLDEVRLAQFERELQETRDAIAKAAAPPPPPPPPPAAPPAPPKPSSAAPAPSPASAPSTVSDSLSPAAKALIGIGAVAALAAVVLAARKE